MKHFGQGLVCLEDSRAVSVDCLAGIGLASMAGPGGPHCCDKCSPRIVVEEGDGIARKAIWN